MRICRFLLSLFVLFIYSCGGAGSDMPSSIGDDSVQTGSTATADPDSITLTASPSSLTVLGTSSVSATVLDSTSANVADGTSVSFSVSSSTLGTITSTASTSSGVATATFTALSTPGTVTVSATAESATATVNIVISASDTGSIEFTSASPTVIGIKGSGQAETSDVTFTVRDINGSTVVDGTEISFSLSGPSGGEYLSATTASTVNGAASVILNSGMVAGPVIIIATVVADTSLTSASSPISIGGGVPNDAHLTIATDTLNLEGLSYVGIEANISVYMADRFGNFNVLTGTTASFYAESGAIDRNTVTGSTGTSSVTFRTQNPAPEDVALIGNATCSGTPSSVSDVISTYASEWERCLLEYVNTTYSISTSNHPRLGWATVFVSTRGEEHFDDANANGVYDSGETIDDTQQEAYLDVNDDGARDDGTSDPFEEFIDDDGDASYDGKNGSWDSDKTIFESLTLLITGAPFYVSYYTSPATIPFTIANDGSQSFKLLVSDKNLNPLIGGTSISITAASGSLSGGGTFTLPDEFRWGPTEISFTLGDADSTTDKSQDASITIKITYKSAETSYIISGTGS